MKRAIIRKTKNHAFSLIYQQGGFCGAHPYNHLKENRINDPLQHYLYAKYKEIRVPLRALWEKWMLVVVTQTKHLYSRKSVGVISTPCKSNSLYYRSYVYQIMMDQEVIVLICLIYFPWKLKKKCHIQYLKELRHRRLRIFNFLVFSSC